MDRRSTPATARVAHISLQGQIDAPAFTEGQVMSIGLPLVDLLRAPAGARERQLHFGEAFTVIDRENGHAFGFSNKDGFCGWLPETALTGWLEPSHWVATTGTHLYPEPRVQALETAALPMGARVAVLGQVKTFAQTPSGFIPAAHLRPIGDRLTDPVSVAEMFLNTPYLWGGNSRAGIDCSGLAQAALLACGIPCPGDSDQQKTLGHEIAPDLPLQRGDLLFWKGHVALVCNAETLIHANGHTMSVAYEGIAACIQRVLDQDGGPVTARRRISR